MTLNDLEINQYQLGKSLDGTLDIVLQRYIQRDKSSRWVIFQCGDVLNKSGEWEMQPLPSGRSEEFLSRTRFDSPEIALDFWNKFKAEIEKELMR